MYSSVLRDMGCNPESFIKSIDEGEHLMDELGSKKKNDLIKFKIIEKYSSRYFTSDSAFNIAYKKQYDRFKKHKIMKNYINNL